MNSKKIQKFVGKIIATQEVEEYKELVVDQIGTLNSFISDLTITDNEIDPIYEDLKQPFGKSVMEDPEDVADEICNLLTLELARKHDLFETFKICYALSFFKDIQKGLRVYKNASDNVRRVCDLLNIVEHTEKDLYIFTFIKDISNKKH